MTTQSPGTEEIARLLACCETGDAGARDRLTLLIYTELKVLASRALQDEREGHTLQTTALVNEVWLRMLGKHDPGREGHARFIALAAQTMRRVLVDHARRRTARKRPTHDKHLSINTLKDIDLATADIDVVDIDHAIERLIRIHPRQARVIDLKCFAGLEMAQIADTLDVSLSTAVRDWRMAKAWMQRELAA
jgi:RNA polymerase sigma factor (TIGR02999 family)